MSDWVCRECGGGFPTPLVRHRRPVCPWCGAEIGTPHVASHEQAEMLLRELGLAGE